MTAHAVYLDSRITDDEFYAYVNEFRREAGWVSIHRPRSVLYDCPRVVPMSAERRAGLGKALVEFNDKLRFATSGMALVTQSTIVRGLLTALNWVAPPGYPSSVVSTLGEGTRFLASTSGGRASAEELLEWYSHYARIGKLLQQGKDPCNEAVMR